MKTIASFLSSALLAGALLSPAPAQAAAAPARILDESSWSLTLSDAHHDGYGFSFQGYVEGFTGPTDAVRVEWSQKGKKLASTRCTLEDSRTPNVGWANCQYSGPKITALGDLTVKVFYVDDQSETETLMRTFVVPVRAFRGSNPGDINYGILADDLLAPGYAYHQTLSSKGDVQMLQLSFWSSGDLTGAGRVVRCTVDGKRLSDFLGATVVSDGPAIGVMNNRNDKKWEEWRWKRNELRIYGLHWGTRAEVEKATGDKVDDKTSVAAGDHPGAWSCDLRVEGQVQRTFRFTIGADGKVAPHPASAAPGALPLMSSVQMIDVILPKQAVDQRVRPEAIRASHSFGVAWPKIDAVQSALKELPPASGLADPEKVKAKKRK